MAKYSIKAPDGNTYDIEGPDGATDDDVRTQVLAEHPEAANAPKTAWQGVKSMLPKSAEFVLGAGSGLVAGPLSGYAGIAGSVLPGPPGQGADWVHKTQDALTYQPESKAAQKGLEIMGLPGEGIRALGGKIGDPIAERFGPVAGTAANILPDTAASMFGMRLPGMRTSFREKMLPGGELPGVAAARADRQMVNAPDDAAAAAANRSGFKLPPADVNPSLLNRTLEWLADKGKNKQAMAAENQPLVQAKIRQQFRLRPDEPLNYDTFERVKHDQLIHYDAARQTGKSPVSGDYLNDIARTLDPLEESQKSYPSGTPSPAIARGNSLLENEFNASGAITKIRELRADAKKAKAESNDVLAEQYKAYANSIETELGRHLQRTGQPIELVQNVRLAREKIAQAETIQKSLSRADEVSPTRLADMKQRGTPMYGDEMREVANLGRYDRASALPSQVGAVQPFSNLEMLAAVMTGGKNMLTLGARPITRGLINSDWFQNQMGRTYGQSKTGKAVQALTSPDAVMRMESFAQATEARKRELARQLGLEE